MSYITRDIVGYGGLPPKVEWPGGTRLALNIAINYEEGSEFGALNTDQKREMMSEVSYPAKETERELVTESLFEYGSRVGIWRIMRILDKYDVTCTIFACALALERNSSVTKAFIKHGYDLLSHRRLHYRQSSVSGLGPNDVNFQIFQVLEGPILLQPIFLKNLRTPFQRNTTYVVVPFSLTHKGNFSIVFPIKSKVLSKIKRSGRVAADGRHRLPLSAGRHAVDHA